MLKLFWKLLEFYDNNLGYTTPLQKRFEIGEFVRISRFKTKECKFNVGDVVKILETNRHDYLISKNNMLDVVYQFELEKNI